MSGLSRCSVPRNAPVANSNTRNSYDGALSAKPGVPGSGGRPLPGGAQSNSVGNRRGWMQVHPAAVSWAGLTPSAFAGAAVEPAATKSVRAAEASTSPKTRFIVRPPSGTPAAAPQPRFLDRHLRVPLVNTEEIDDFARPPSAVTRAARRVRRGKLFLCRIRTG